MIRLKVIRRHHFRQRRLSILAVLCKLKFGGPDYRESRSMPIFIMTSVTEGVGALSDVPSSVCLSVAHVPLKPDLCADYVKVGGSVKP